MFQLALPASLLRFRQRAPSLAPLLQLPKRRATRTPEAPFLSPYIFTFLLVQNLCGGRPPLPLCGYADKRQEKNGRADGPVGTASLIVENPAASAIKGTMAAITEAEGNTHPRGIVVNTIASTSAGASLERRHRYRTESWYCSVLVRILPSG